LKSELFDGTEPTINLGKLRGSEGTLAFTTEVTLKVDALLHLKNIMVVHFHSIQESHRCGDEASFVYL
jgi:FAD/FMN-containing dehydrogenase